MAGSIALGVEHPAIGLADRGDDAGLRQLMQRSVMPGSVRIAFTREPDYFAGDGLAGADDVTIVARRDGAVVGSGRCSIYPLARNGAPSRIGYLGLLRIADSTRQAARLIREGYELLGAEVQPRADAFFTSIATENARARRVLERGGGLGLPRYEALCELVTIIAPVRRRPVRVRERVDVDELLEFLLPASREFHLSLDWNTGTINNLQRHGVGARDFVALRRQGRIAGAAAVWDQRGFRQTVIAGYDGALATLRPLVNAGLVMRGRPVLPAPGTVLPQAVLLGATVRDPDDWPDLWRAVQASAAERGVDWLTISRDARDPELSVLRRLTRGREYRTMLYDVTWAGGRKATWDRRLFRPEVGLL